MRERNNEVTEAVKPKPAKGPNSEINLSWLAKIQAPYTDNIYIYHGNIETFKVLLSS